MYRIDNVQVDSMRAASISKVDLEAIYGNGKAYYLYSANLHDSHIRFDKCIRSILQRSSMLFEQCMINEQI